MAIDSHKLIHLLFNHLDEAKAAVLQNPELLRIRCLWGESPLHYMAIEEEIDAVKLLIELGADLNDVDSSGNTALNEVLGTGNLELIALLLDSGADPNHRAEIWEWPIIDALERGTLELCELLLSKGARPIPGEDFALHLKWTLKYLDNDTRAEAWRMLERHWSVETCERLRVLADENDH